MKVVSAYLRESAKAFRAKEIVLFARFTRKPRKLLGCSLKDVAAHDARGSPLVVAALD
jgi:hypothetical protein